ncbi:hypothetical protein B0J18DRAFT_465702 [Chaetomium sp. MPI-SDFR-AT-0129]|nr:hypothetical protein B0J18DRAFT_465702 [Chaetomium sp. MPI-SDFR-AT-0129]
MTSPVQPPATQQPAMPQQQQHQHANAPATPSTPAAPTVPIHSAVSPPNKRDLKSWWKGFKLPSKHQESHGTAAPSVIIPFPRTAPQRTAALFAEDMDGVVDCPPPAPSLLWRIVSEEDRLTAHRASASASMSQPPTTTAKAPRKAPKLGAFSRILVAWRSLDGPHTRAQMRRKSCPAGTKLIVAEHRPQGIFGVPLRQSITYANVAISLIDEDGKSYIYGYVPIVVAKCGVFLKERATEIEGIFRLSGSEKRIKELKSIFDSPDRYGKGLVWDGYTVHDAANVLRRYLNDLPEPVVPLDLYEKFREPLRGATRPGATDAEGPQFVEHFNMTAAVIRYQQLITELPPLNRQLLLYILDLLAVFAAKSDQNRMTSQNLAAIFQPGMLSHPNHAMAPEEYRLNQCVIIFLIENQDHFLIGMHGTAADEKTVEEVQKGTPQLQPPSTPTNQSKLGVYRSASTASAGAESVAKEGSIRRNKSTSSRRSYRSNNGSASPAVAGSSATGTANAPVAAGSVAAATTSGVVAGAATPTGGLTRSNTLPSKKSPSLQSGKFASRNDSHIAPLTPVTPAAEPVISPPALVEEMGTLSEEQPAQKGPIAGSSTSSGVPQPSLTVPGTKKSQEKLLEPPTPEALTPSKERKLPVLFQRMASSENDGRPPNKLRKKRLPGSANPSAHSSTASLSHSTTAISPNADAGNPLEVILSASKVQNTGAAAAAAAAQLTSETSLDSASRPPHAVPSSSNADADHVRPPVGTHTAQATQHQQEQHQQHQQQDGSQIATHAVTDPAHDGHPHAETLHPDAAHGQPSLRSRKSPPTSLHSSFNEGSDHDQLGESTTFASIEAASPDTMSEKEKKKRWRLSRKKDETSPPPFPAMTSPRHLIGSNATALASGTSINSSGRPGRSTMGDTSDRTTINTDAPLVEVSSREGREGKEGRDGKDGKDDANNKLSSWIKNKYREHKENVEHRRNKSPPATERTASIPSLLSSSRGKSLDLKRVEDKENPSVPVPHGPQSAHPASAVEPTTTSTISPVTTTTCTTVNTEPLAQQPSQTLPFRPAQPPPSASTSTTGQPQPTVQQVPSTPQEKGESVE